MAQQPKIQKTTVTIPKSIQPSHSRTLQKPPTVSESRIIRKYGSLEAYNRARSMMQPTQEQIVAQQRKAKEEAIKQELLSLDKEYSRLMTKRQELLNIEKTRSLTGSEASDFNMYSRQSMAILSQRSKVAKGQVSSEAVMGYASSRAIALTEQARRTKAPELKMTTRTEQIAAQELSPVRSLDFVSESGRGAGAMTVYGGMVGETELIPDRPDVRVQRTGVRDTTQLPKMREVTLPPMKQTIVMDPLTGRDIPQVSMVAEGRPESFPSFLQRGIQTTSGIVRDKPFEEAPARGLPGLFSMEFETDPSARGTARMVPTKKTSEEKLMAERYREEMLPKTVAEETAHNKAEEIFKKAQLRVNSQISSGMSEAEIKKMVSEEELNAQRELALALGDIEREYKEEFTTREKNRVTGYLKRELSNKWKFFAQGVISSGLYAIPLAGSAFAASDVVEGVRTFPETVSLWKAEPTLRKDIIGAGVAGFAGVLAGGAAIGSAKGFARQSKIRASLREAKMNYQFKGKLTEKVITGLKLAPDEEVRLLNLIKQQRNVRYVEVSSTPKKGMEKTTPKIKGRIVEILNADGEVIRRISIGELKATLNGKTVKRQVLSEAIGKVRGEKGSELFSKTLLITEGKLRWDPFRRKFIDTTSGKEYTFKEASKVVSKDQLKNIQTAEIETSSDILGYRKVKSSDFPIGRPEITTKRGIPFTKGKQETLTIKTNPDTSLIFGKGTSSRVDVIGLLKGMETPLFTFSKTMKPFVEKAAKTVKSKPKPTTTVKTTTSTGNVLVTQLTPEGVGIQRMVGGLGIESVSTGAYQIGGAFVSELPLVFTTGITKTALGVGMYAGLAPPLTRVGKLGTKTLQDLRLRQLDELDLKVKFKDKLKLDELTTEQGLITKVAPPKTLVKTAILHTITKPAAVQSKILSTAQQDLIISEPAITSPEVDVPWETSLNIKFPGEEDKKYIKYQGVGYNAWGKQSGTGKWIKLNKKPMTRRGAESRGAEAVDKSLSRRFKLEPVTITKTVKGKKKSSIRKYKNPSKQLDRGNRYWNQAQVKFRPYKIKKGKAIPLREEYIEKSKFALDTKGETQKIQLAKKKAVATRNFLGMPQRRSRPRRGSRKNFFGI